MFASAPRIQRATATTRTKYGISGSGERGDVSVGGEDLSGGGPGVEDAHDIDSGG